MLRTAVVGVAALAASMLFAGTALAGPAAGTKFVTVTATYAGKANVKVVDQLADITATGKGTGTIVGAGTVTGKGTGDASQQPCVPFAGTGLIKGTAGTTISFKMASGSQGCGDEAGEIFSIVGRATVLKATGKLAKAKGSLKVTGTYNHTTGAFTVKFNGKLVQ